MDLVSLLKIALRQWYVVLPIVFTSLALAAYVQVATPSEFHATGSILLAGPSLDPSRVSSTTVDARGLATELSEAAARQQFADSGAGAQYAIAPLDDATFEVVATDEEQSPAVRTARAVADRFVSVVQEQQEGVPELDRVRARVLTTDVVAEQQVDGSFRAAAIVLVEDPGAGLVNPYPPAAATARVIEVTIESDDGRLRVAQAVGSGIAFDLSQQPRDTAPIIAIDTFGSDPQRTLEAFEHIRNVINQELDERQVRASVPVRRRTTTEVLAEPLTVVDVSPPLRRAAAAIVALGGLLALGSAFLMEGFTRRRYGYRPWMSTSTNAPGPDEIVVAPAGRSSGGGEVSGSRDMEPTDRSPTSATLPH